MEILDLSEKLTEYPANFIKFLGTAGTRFVMLSQRRASGGIWFSYGGCRGVIDPGPGSLVRICSASPRLSALDIDALILTHRHIDHSSDLSALAEGMTLKAHEPKGRVILTDDSIEDGDAVLLKYIRKKIKHVKRHRDGKRRKISSEATVESVIHSHDRVECYGLIFRAGGLPTWGLIGDTAALPFFPERYAECEMLVINVTLPFPWRRIAHMSLPDVDSLLQKISPKLVIMTHMGDHVLDMEPEALASRLTTERTEVIPAWDGMTVKLS